MKITLARVLRGVTAISAVALMTGCGIAAPSHSDGYADFDAPRYQGMKRDTSISLGPRVIRFAANHVSDDAETEALLRAIDGVRVNVYQLTEDVDRSALTERLNSAAQSLGKDNWKSIARVTDEEKTVFVMLKQTDSEIVGITVLSADEEEFVFVNVMGTLSPELIAKLGEELPEGDRLSLVSAAFD